MHTKRAYVGLGEKLLLDAAHHSGETNYSRAIERAIEDFVRRAKRFLRFRSSSRR